MPDENSAEHGSSHRHPHSGSDHHGACDWEEEIRHHLDAGRVVLGVGSRLRGDDAAGPVVAAGLAERGVPHAYDCGGVPENYVGKVEKIQPSHILFVDAVDFGSPPGTIGFYGGGSFDFQSFSTHSAGLSPLMDYLAGTCEARCWVLSIQPENTDYGADMSRPVREAVDRIISSSVWKE